MNTHRSMFVYLVLSVLMIPALACGMVSIGIETPETIVETSSPGTDSEELPSEKEQIPTVPDPSLTPVVESDGQTPPPQEFTTGLSLVYVKDGNVWLWSEPGTSKALTSSGEAVSARISSDGKIVAFLRQIDDFHYELWAVNSDASGERRLISADEVDKLYPDQRQNYTKSIVPYTYKWVPGTHIVAYNTRQMFEGPGLALLDDMRLIDVDTLEDSMLLPPAQGGEFTYSPDGKQIVLVTPTQISVVQADGSNRRDLLTYDQVITYSEYWYYAHPLWSEDSTYLRVVIPPAEALAEQRQPTTLWHLPTDGTDPYQLSSFATAPFFATETAISPDMQRVMYVREAGSPGQDLRELHLANIDGSDDQTIEQNRAIQFVSWAPDSQHFIFSYYDTALKLQIGEVNGSFHGLTSNPEELLKTQWLDAQRFFYLRPNGESFEIRLDTLDGKTTLIDIVQGDPPSYDFTS
jgi:hypothetical protein